jgi:hypothetical protein
LRFSDTSEVPGVLEDGLGVIGIHVATDAIADAGGEGIGGHGGGKRESSTEALPQQQSQPDATEGHVSGQNQKQPNGQGIAEFGRHLKHS